MTSFCDNVVVVVVGSKAVMSKKFTLRGLTEDQRIFLEGYAQTHLGTPVIAKAILGVINEKMNEANSKNDIKIIKVIDPKSKNQNKKRVQISLKENEYELLQHKAESVDTSIQYYIIRLILKDLYNENRLLGNEIEQLRKSNYELHKIGVNINQIAKSINSGEQDKFNIDSLYDDIINHIEIVKKILSINLERY